jgi:TRAP-type mannitol/chloroaromatic compound transport system substrate-binding protein
MDRREFLITSSGAAVAAASATPVQAEGAPAPPAAAIPLRGTAPLLRLAMPWTDAPQGPADGAHRLARRLEALTGGRYRIEIAASVGSVPDHDAELALCPAHDFAPLHPAFAYFAGLPGSGGLGAQDLAHWIAIGGGQMLWDDLSRRHGWKPLLAGHSGEAPPLWSRQPIHGLSDLAGRRIAAPGLGGDVARALGAEAGEAPPPRDAAAALAEGTLFAAEAGGLMTSLALGLAGSAAYATGEGLNGRGTALALHVRLVLWERLSETDKAIFAAAASEAFQLSLAEQRAHAGIARRVLEARGVRLAPWPSDIAEALGRVAEATIAHVAGRDEIALGIDRSYVAFRNLLSETSAPRRTSPADAIS